MAFRYEHWIAKILLAGVPLGICLLAVIAVWQAAQKRVWMTLLAVAAGAGLVAFVATHVRLPRLFLTAPPTCERPLHVVTLNVFGPNRDTQRLLGYLEAISELDVVFLQEVTRRRTQSHWHGFLDSLRARFPYQTAASDLVIASRIPFSAPENTRLARHAIQAVINVEGADVLLVSVHLFTSPLNSERLQRRNRDLDRLAEALSQVNRPVIMGADLNGVPWSPSIAAFFRRTGLELPMSNLPVATRPAWLPYVGAQVDYIAATDGAFSGVQFTGPDVGSDHRPLEAWLCPDRRT